MSLTLRLTKFCAAVSVAALAAGCAHSPNDPLEGYNRQAFYFNEAMDTVVIKPIAHGYHDLLPDVVQTVVRNFFGNIADVWIAVNNFLQGRGDEGFSDVSRIMVNTLVGVGGAIDVASEAGLQKHNEDFGQTLGVWGAPPGPYFVIPILGPSTIRDTIAVPADYWFGDPITYIYDRGFRWGAIALRGISKRAELIDAAAVIDDAAIDKYEFIRDAYLQRRQRMVHDKDLADSQWETIKEEDGKKVKKKEVIEQIWLPSGELMPLPSPGEAHTDKVVARTPEADAATAKAPAEAVSADTVAAQVSDEPAKAAEPTAE
ncbi:MAG: VacJ family lipoprotein, partial [Burkholderiaceae bacterium]|nr:VacJ family lipoprotein [Burkholderiaceae bacterium]